MLNPITDTDRDALRADLPEAVFRDISPAYLEEPRGRYQGGDGFLLAPDRTDQVAHILRYCHDHRIGVVPYGGGTGLVGGQIAEHGAPVIVSLERMTKLRDTSPLENVAVTEAGAILETVQNAAADVDRLFPLTLASQGSARIGGLLATNAGGVNTLRYGNARDLCLGLEAVLPDGTVFNGLTRLRKNNTGYDLRHLLIGAEGTLGIITAAALKLFPRPSRRGVAMLAVTSPQAALDLLALAGDVVGNQISAFELIHRQGLDFLTETDLPYRAPFDDVPDWMVLIDLGAFGSTDPQAALEVIFGQAHTRGLVTDGTIAQSDGQATDLWAIRETIPEGNRRIGSVSSHDISVPLARIPDFIDAAGAALAKLGDFRINCFGHVGDGNLHYNVFPVPGKTRDDYEAERPQVKRIVHDLVSDMDGSVSAEHGIGRLKVDDLERYADPGKLSAMRAIKAALDPHGIMNPGAVLRDSD